MSQPIAEPKKNTSKKVKALLAGGLVLGIGAAVTLAAWTDEQWAQGIFGTGSFAIESSVDGASFDDYAEGNEAQLTFNLTDAELPADITPGDTFAAPFVVQATESSDYDGELRLEDAGVNTTVNTNNLTYGIVQVDSVGECDTAVTGTDPFVSAGTPLGSPGTDETVLDLTPGTPVVLCFQVTASDELEQSTEITAASWQFLGTSVE